MSATKRFQPSSPMLPGAGVHALTVAAVVRRVDVETASIHGRRRTCA